MEKTKETAADVSLAEAFSSAGACGGDDVPEEEITEESWALWEAFDGQEGEYGTSEPDGDVRDDKPASEPVCETICYMVDLENTGNAWADALCRARPCDEIYIFWTKNASKIDIAGLSHYMGLGSGIHFCKCGVGKSGLDFQLCSEMGYLAAVHPDWKFRVISDDKEYDVLIPYWREKGIAVGRLPVRNDVRPPAQGPSKKEKAKRKAQSLADRQRSAVARWESELAPVFAAGRVSQEAQSHFLGVMKAASQVKKEDRMMKVYRDTVNRFGQDKGLALYRVVKSGISKLLAEDQPYPQK